MTAPYIFYHANYNAYNEGESGIPGLCRGGLRYPNHTNGLMVRRSLTGETSVRSGQSLSFFVTIITTPIMTDNSLIFIKRRIIV